MSSKFVISDIHGCFLTFEALLNKIGLSKNDELILLGDYINRGKRSKQVVDRIIELTMLGYNLTCLKGNHEDMVFDSIGLEDWSPGEEETLKSFGINHLNELDPKYIHWFKNLVPYYENENFIFVHAGLNFKVKKPFEDTYSMRWLVDWYDNINYTWLKERGVIHGHQIIEQRKIEEMLSSFHISKVLNIDNGCFLQGSNGFGNLSCLNLTKWELVAQKNIDG